MMNYMVLTYQQCMQVCLEMYMNVEDCMQKIWLFLPVGLVCFALLTYIFPPNTSRTPYLRYIFLLGVLVITAGSTSFFYTFSHYFLFFDWMAIVIAIVFESLILFFVFGMVFGLDYYVMTQRIKQKLSRKS